MAIALPRTECAPSSDAVNLNVARLFVTIEEPLLRKGAALPNRPGGLLEGQSSHLEPKRPMEQNSYLPINEELLRILVCPACHSRVELVDGPGLLRRGCGLKYPVRDGIPVMLVGKAQPPGAKTPQ